MELIQSTAANFPIFMFDSSDHVSGKTGLTLTIAISKNGGASAAITPTVTEIGNGRYNLALTTAHTDTLGPINGIATSTGADPQPFEALVVLAKALDSTVAKDATVSKPWTAQTISSNADITTILGRVDVATSTRSAPGTAQTITAPADMALNSTVAKEATLNTKIPTALSFTGANVNVESKVTAAPSDMALNSTVAKDATVSKPGTAQTISSNADITAIKAKTDGLPASPAAVGSAMTLATGAITAAVIATNAIDADAIAADAIAEIQYGLSRPGIAQAIIAPADMALDSTVAKAAQLAALPSASEISTAVGGAPLAGGITRDFAWTAAGTVAASKKSGMIPGTATTATIRLHDDSADFMEVDLDANGNTTDVRVAT